MKVSLPSQAILRPITVTMMVVTLIIFGAISGSRLPIEFLPPMELPFLGCFISYPGATPAQVEEEIAILAEGEFRTLSNLRNLYTFSNAGGCFISFNFDWGADMNSAIAEVRDRIERLRLVLPPGADQIFIRNFNSDAMPVVELGLSRPGDFNEFAHLVRTVLVPKLKRLDGVAEVELWGAEEESVLIEFDQDALRSFNLPIFGVVQTLQTSSLNVSAGELPDGQRRYLVRALGEFQRPSELAEVIVGPGLRLKDIATVRYAARDTNWHFSIDGHQEIFLMVKKEAGANTVATCDAVLEELNALLQTPAFEGTAEFVFMNQAEVIREALDGLTNAGKFGGILAIFVIFLFLGRAIPTVVVALAIPGSLVASLVVLYFAGMTLNLVTMMSMIIAVGMVVDNSIVVVENIYRYRGLGYSPREAARLGANEVGLAITAATMTTAVVFIPVIYLDGGQMSVFMRQFAIPVTVSLGASLVLALTVIPLAVSRIGLGTPGFIKWALRKRPTELEERAFERGGLLFRPFVWLVEVYGRCLSWALRWRLAAMLIIAGLVWLTFAIPARQVGFQALPTMDRRVVTINVNFDPNYDVPAALEVMTDLENAVNDRREELGVKHVFKRVTPRESALDVFLLTKDDVESRADLPYSTDDVLSILRELLPERFPGGRIRLNSGEQQAQGGGGGGGGLGQARVSLRMQGDDARTLENYTETFMALMETLPDVIEVEKSSRPPDQEIRLHIDEVLAEQAGVNPTIVAQTVGFALMGSRLPELKEGGREVPVWAQFREADRESRANLDNVMVQGADEMLTPISQLVNYTRGESPQTISRLNGKNYVMVTARTAQADLSNVREDLRALIDSYEMPTGYAISFGDELREMEQNMQSFNATLLLSVILIYIVMGALFESWLLPLSILTSIPLAFLGVFWMMWITGTPIDTVAFIGMVLMVGLVVNNGIVIVDYINNLRRGGRVRHDAIVQAGKDRLRPVLMTAITTILGAVPLAIGTGMGGESITSLGRALIGGLTTGTFLTLLIVPLFYTFVDDAQVWLGRFLANVTGLGRGSTVRP